MSLRQSMIFLLPLRPSSSLAFAQQPPNKEKKEDCEAG
jgi:hypothetical protein